MTKPPAADRKLRVETRHRRVSGLESRNTASPLWPERVAAIFLAFAVLYFGVHIVAAWLRGSFKGV